MRRAFLSVSFLLRECESHIVPLCYLARMHAQVCSYGCVGAWVRGCVLGGKRHEEHRHGPGGGSRVEGEEGKEREREREKEDKEKQEKIKGRIESLMMH